MAVNIQNARNEAADAVLAALQELYKESSPDPDAMRGFAEAIAESAVAAVTHIVERAETELGGEGLV